MRKIGKLTYLVLGTLAIIWLAALLADDADAKGGGGSSGGGGASSASAGRASAPSSSTRTPATSSSQSSSASKSTVSAPSSSTRSPATSSSQSSSASKSTVSATRGGTGYASSNGKRVTPNNGVVTKTGTHSASTGKYNPTRHDRYAYRSDLTSPWFILWASDHGWTEGDLEDASEQEAALAQYNAEIDADDGDYTMGIVVKVILAITAVAILVVIVAVILRHRAEKKRLARQRERYRSSGRLPPEFYRL